MQTKFDIWVISLTYNGFVHERVVFIPCGDWSGLFEFEWENINIVIEGVL